jgi:pyruvate/2-oxoglutarate dehydrogenase complex dihydrolipoamide acyltransferase (E2) component
VASANPATVPVGSVIGVVETMETTPEVPMETTTSPGSAARPRAAAALSPVPGPSTAPPSAASAPAATVPAGSAGPRTRGTTGVRPNARSSRSRRYSPVRGDQ